MGRSSIGSLGTDFTSRHWLSLDPCGLICLSFSYALHLFALFASAFTLIAHHTVAQILYGTLYVPFSLLSIWSLTKACGTDPGAVPLGARPIPANLAVESDSIVTERDGMRGGMRRRRGIRRCRKCNDNYKPARAHHDSVTGRCVVKMDHYCPWVGNAVGIMNHKFFILFILYTFLTAVVSLTLILMRVIRCEYYVPPGASTAINNTDPQHPGCNSNHTPIVFVLGIITLLFFFFTFCMLLEQTEAISTNMSKIARMKTRAGMVSHPNEYAPVATEFNEVFGGEHPSLSWHWLLPLTVKFPEWAMDNIMGYEWDETFAPVAYQEQSECDSSTFSGGNISRTSSYTSDGGGGGGEGLGMDVETGGGGGLEQQAPLEQELLHDEEKEMLVGSSESTGVKKRSSGSFT